MSHPSWLRTPSMPILNISQFTSNNFSKSRSDHFLFNKLKTGFRLIYLPKSMPIQTLHNRRNKRTGALNEPSIEGWKSMKALNISNTLWSRPLHNVRNFRYISPNPINKHNKAYRSKYQYQ